MNIYSFIQWCFRDGGSTIVTVIVLGMLLSAIVKLARAIRGSRNYYDDDEDDD